METYEEFEKHLAQLRARVDAAARACGRNPSDVKILPVTKTHPLAAAEYAVRAGFAAVGENKVQEAVGKMQEAQKIGSCAGLQWELIGHLQTNKAKKAVENFARIQSVDSVKLLEKIDFEAEKIGKIQRVLLQINSGEDPAKFGADIADAPALMEAALSKKHVAVEGLMAIAPLDENPDSARRAFRTLREIRNTLSQKFSAALPELSMGMSGDLEAAVEEGSTMIRVGTFLFGQRIYPTK